MALGSLSPKTNSPTSLKSCPRSLHRSPSPWRSPQAFVCLSTLSKRSPTPPLLPPPKKNISWAIDIPSALATSGHLPAAPDALLLTLADALQKNPALMLPARVIHIDTTPYHNAGADPSTELALALSTAAWTVDNLTDAGVPLERACQSLSFGFAVDSDFFLQISKLRAARLLWSKITSALGLTSPAAQMWQVASTSHRTLTRFDPWCNLLRATLQTAAAVLGGADEVRVTPFDALSKPRSAWGRRLARNTQLILRDESKLHALLDPTSGSGQTESMTAALSDFAWSRFQEIERSGGLIQHLASGNLFTHISQSASKRATALAKRLPPIIGVSDFPSIPEHPLPSDDLFSQSHPQPPQKTSDIPDPAPQSPGAYTLPHTNTLTEARDAAPFESLRLSIEALSPLPTAWLLCLGPLAEHLPRLNFSSQFVAVAGITTSHSEDISSAADALAAYQAAHHKNLPPDVLVLCGTDDRYATLAADIAQTLKHPNIWLAGRPGEREQSLKDAGIHGFLFMGCDVVATLRHMFKAHLSGVSPTKRTPSQ